MNVRMHDTLSLASARQGRHQFTDLAGGAVTAVAMMLCLHRLPLVCLAWDKNKCFARWHHQKHMMCAADLIHQA